MNARRGFVGRLAWLGLAAVLALACSSDKKTLLLIDVSLLPGVAAPTSVTIDVAAASASVGSQDFNWADAKNGTLQIGIYLPEGISGLVAVTATGKAGGIPQSKASKETNVLADKTNGPIGLSLGAIEVAVGDAGVDANADASAAEVPEGDASFGGLEVGGLDASVSDAPVQDANLGLVDAPVGEVLGDTAGDGEGEGGLTWLPAENVEKDPTNRSLYPAVAVEPITENVLVAWYEASGVKVMRYDRQAGTWGAPKTLDSRGLPNQVAVVTDASGNIMVVWVQHYTGPDSSLYGVWASQSNDGIAWSPAQQVVSGTVFSLTVAMARNGIARMAWVRETATNAKGLFTAYYDKSSWKVDSAPVLDSKDPGVVDPAGPQLAISGTGEGILAFDANDESNNTSVGVVNLTGATRSSLRILDTNTTDDLDSRNRSVAMNPNGEGVVAWAENSNGSAALNLAYYRPSIGWTSPQKVAAGGGFYTLGSALDNSGNITLAWVQRSTGLGDNVMAIHGKSGGTWGQVTPLETDNTVAANYNEFATPVLAADGAGNVLAVWSKRINATTLGAYARRLQGTTWQPEVKLGQKADLKVFLPRVAVGDSGFGAATFVYQWNSTTDPDAYNVEVAFCK